MVRLFTVGPVEVRDEVMEAMNRPMIVHRSQEYKELHRQIVDKLHKVLETDMEIMLATASSTGFLEGCVRNGVERKVLGISNGSFGERWQSIAAANGKDVRRLRVPWGESVKPEVVSAEVTEDTEAVTLVTNESSTGVFNPVERLVKELKRDHSPLVFLDGVTSIGAMDLELDELDVDALVFGTQKALALPPGLAVVCVSDRLLAKAERVTNRGYYFDFLRLKEYNDRDYAMTTPPISLLYGLNFQLDRMLEEGMQNRYSRHQKIASMVREWAEECLGLFAEEGYRSNTITVVNKPDFSFEELQRKLIKRGYQISAGYGKLKEKTFRIGHMGDLTVEDAEVFLDVLDEVVEELE